MKTKARLSSSMTIDEFDNGYWYATEIKAFATSIGVTSSAKLRKDELEEIIKEFLRSGEIRRRPKRSLSRIGVRDSERGLRLALPVVNYTNDRETKDFIVREAKKAAPEVRPKSGARYRLNRWREQELSMGKKITYRDLVNRYVELNRTEGRFPQAPSGRYINFLSDYLAKEKGATRADALRAWKTLKKINVPKTYASWAKAREG